MKGGFTTDTRLMFPETITLGTTNLETMQMNLYNKSAMLDAKPYKANPKEFLDKSLPYGKDLYNIEFVANRNVLKSFGLTTLKECGLGIGSLWFHATNNFVIFPDESGMPRKEWIEIQNAIPVDSRSLLRRKTKKKQSPNEVYRYDKVEKSIESYLDIGDDWQALKERLNKRFSQK